MKKFFLISAGIAALTVSMPASAQVGEILRQGVESILGGGGGTNSRLNELNRRIQASDQRNEITQTQANRLQNELNSIAQLEQNYRNDGLSRYERDELQRRLQMVENRFEQARYNRDGRDDRWGDRDDRYGRDDRWEDRDDRWGDDARNGRGCPPGLAKKNNGCLPPGQVGREDGRYRDTYGYRDGDANEWRRDRDDGMDRVERKDRKSKVKGKKNK